MCGKCSKTKTQKMARPPPSQISSPEIGNIKEFHKNMVQQDPLSPLSRMMSFGSLLQEEEEEEEVVREVLEEDGRDSVIKVSTTVTAHVGAHTQLNVNGVARENGVYASPAWPGMRMLVIAVNDDTVVMVLRPLSSNMTGVKSIRLPSGSVLREVDGMPQFTSNRVFGLPKDPSTYSLHCKDRKNTPETTHCPIHTSKQQQHQPKTIPKIAFFKKVTRGLSLGVARRRERRNLRRIKS